MMFDFLTTNTVKHKYFDSLKFGEDMLMRGQFFILVYAKLTNLNLTL